MNALTQSNFKLISLKISSGLLGWCLVAAVLCGCFQADNKFYLDSDIKVDTRLEGRFGPQVTDPNSSETPSLVLKLGREKHYIATFQERGKWIKLDAVLFQCGTNLFVDICHLDDNGMKNEPAVGPSALEMLHIATRSKTHSAIRVLFVENAVEFQFGYGNSILAAITKVPGLKLNPAEKGSPILADPTEKVRSFLERAGNDDANFENKSRWVKIAK